MIPLGQFGLIYADPPWAYRMYSEKGHGKTPYAHYECMSHEDLMDMRDSIMFSAGEECVLFMWAVWPKIHDALELMKHWGFTYKTGGAWHKKTKHGKTAFGTGYILRSACEPFLIGTIGEPSINNRSTRNLIEAATREHSRKPDETIEFLEGLFDGPYLELFARTQRDGWTTWGNETEKFSEATA